MFTAYLKAQIAVEVSDVFSISARGHILTLRVAWQRTAGIAKTGMECSSEITTFGNYSYSPLIM